MSRQTIMTGDKNKARNFNVKFSTVKNIITAFQGKAPEWKDRK
jgi:hypothetical protein